MSATERTAEPTVSRDIHYREALFFANQDAYFPAIIRLLAASEKPGIRENAEEQELMLGRLLLSFGLDDEAMQVLDRLLKANPNPDIRDRAWLQLAGMRLQRGDLVGAQQALEYVGNTLATELGSKRRQVQMQLHIRNGDYDHAIALLNEWSRRDPWAAYAKFNLGVAMSSAGRTDTAATLLEELGRVDASNEEMTSLRDKANLALGYIYLQSGRPEAAGKTFKRVRFTGPFSNKALLGIGWAESNIDDHERALVPWMELRGRGLLDPAVHESMLAIPYAMTRLDALNEAAMHYEIAVDGFAEASRRIDAAIEHVRSGQMAAALAPDFRNTALRTDPGIDEFPEGSQWRYLYPLLATREFQSRLTDLRDLKDMSKSLGDWRRDVDVLRVHVAAREFAHQQRLPRAQAGLSQSTIDDLLGRKHEFDARLADIEISKDSLALATGREFEMWAGISAVGTHRALAAEITEAEEAQHKVNLLRGVLQWKLDQEFEARLTRARRDLADIDHSLATLQQLRQRLEDAIRHEEQMIAKLKKRVAALGPRVDEMRARIDVAITGKRASLEAIAIENLRAQKTRLADYEVQARFALAAIYDVAATGSPPVSGGAMR